MLLSNLRRFRPSLRTLRQGLVVLALLPLALTVDGCDSVSPFAPTGSTITLAAGTQTMALNEVTDVRAFVTQSGGSPVHNGTVVYFSSSLGTMIPDHSETNDGVATVQFASGTTTGQAQLSAVSGAAKLSAALTVTITFGGATVARLTLTPSPATVPVGGGTVQLTALAVDASGNPVPNVPVSFTTTAGTLSTTIPVLTNLNGQAVNTLTTTTIATVTATAPGGVTATAVISIQ